MTSSAGRRSSASLRAGGLAILLTFGLAVAAGAADEIATLVAAPLTPGNVALLARHFSDPRVVERLRAAFASPSSAVRSVAARAAAVGNLGSILTDLKDALAPERRGRKSGRSARSAARPRIPRLSPRRDDSRLASTPSTPFRSPGCAESRHCPSISRLSKI